MKALSIAGVGAIFAGAAVGLAAPASAALLDGTYQVILATGHTTTWVVTPCGTGCKHFQMPGGTDEYHLNANTWTSTSDPDFVSTIDDNTLAGVGGVNTFLPMHFQLVKVS